MRARRCGSGEQLVFSVAFTSGSGAPVFASSSWIGSEKTSSRLEPFTTGRNDVARRAR